MRGSLFYRERKVIIPGKKKDHFLLSYSAKKEILSLRLQTKKMKGVCAIGRRAEYSPQPRGLKREKEEVADIYGKKKTRTISEGGD